MGWPQSEQRSSTWLIWPQAWCRYSTGGPASPASHLSPHATMTISTSNNSSPLAVSTYSCRGGRAEQARQFEAAVRSMYQQMARITIQPRWARYYDFGGGRVPGFLLKLAQGNPEG